MDSRSWTTRVNESRPGFQVLVGLVLVALIVGVWIGRYSSSYESAKKGNVASTGTPPAPPAQAEQAARVLQTSAVTKPDAAEAETDKKSPPAENSCEKREHEIVKGDTLTKISAKYYGGRTSLVDFLADENQITNKNLIFIGKKLVIPSCLFGLPEKSPSGTRISATMQQQPERLGAMATAREAPSQNSRPKTTEMGVEGLSWLPLLAAQATSLFPVVVATGEG